MLKLWYMYILNRIPDDSQCEIRNIWKTMITSIFVRRKDETDTLVRAARRALSNWSWFCGWSDTLGCNNCTAPKLCTIPKWTDHPDSGTVSTISGSLDCTACYYFALFTALPPHCLPLHLTILQWSSAVCILGEFQFISLQPRCDTVYVRFRFRAIQRMVM